MYSNSKKISTMLAIIMTVSMMLFSLSACSTAEDTETVLTITKDDVSKSLTMSDIKELPAVECSSYFMNSSGEIMGPFNAKGAPLTELCNLAGGMDSNDAARVIAKDGYSMTISQKRITNSDFTTFDVNSGSEIEHGDLTVILAYEQDGEPIDPTTDGPLRVMVVGDETEVTEGHWWVKWIENIDIVLLERPWEVTLEGAITEVMDHDTFKSEANPGHHGISWKDGQGRSWEGMALWYLVANVDDENTQRGSFNEELADQGYEVQLIAADGYTVTFSSEEIKDNNDLIIAYNMNGEPVGEKYWPLRLVGKGLEKNQMVGQIARVKLVFP